MPLSAIALCMWIVGVEPSASPVFTWSVPDEGCPSAQQVRDDVDRMRATPEHSLDVVRVHAQVSRAAPTSWTLDLSIMTARGHTDTRLRASTCETLAEAAALFIALATDPQGSVEHTQVTASTNARATADATHAAAPESTTLPAPTVTTTAPDPRPVPPNATSPTHPNGSGLQLRRGTRDRTLEPRRAQQPLQWRLRIMGAGSLGVLPSLRAGLGGGLALVTRHVRVDLQGSYWFRRRTPISEAPGASLVTSAGYGSVRGCPWTRIRQLELGGCLGLDAGRVTVGSDGLLDPTPARVLWLSATGDFLLGWHPIERMTIVLEPGLILALRRRRFAVEGVGEVLQMGLLGGRVALGLEVSL